MAQQKNKYLSPAHEQADGLLREWQSVDRKVKALEARAEAALAQVAPELPELLRAAKENRDFLAKVIENHEKKHQAELFGEVKTLPASVSVNLPAGTLLYNKTEYVVKGRKVLANLLKYGFMDEVKVTFAPDWDALADREEWPDAALEMLGTRREVKEIYSFDLKDKPCSS